MNLVYYKRFRMEIGLSGQSLTPNPLPEGYFFLPWEESLLDCFAMAKYLSFRDEMDTHVFPCLADFAGCRRLMNEIAGKPGFLPEATWLLVYREDRGGRVEYCGTVQGVRDEHGFGAIQNLGVAVEHRRRGLGTSLLLRSLDGFRRRGVRRVFLDVTAENSAAVRLYRKIGFNTNRIVYKTVETANHS
ncbi:MAG: GNAT family N-acetyltransferase [Pirellulales bacterium]|nr:GNAT family N-acetyltransferase [Pirellulales bacterium]